MALTSQSRQTVRAVQTVLTEHANQDQGAGADRALRASILQTLSRAMDFQFYAWLLCDPQTSVGTAPLAQVPDLTELPRLVGLKYRTTINRWTAIPPGSCLTLAAATGGQLGRSELWRRALQRHGVTDVASLVFRDKWGWWGWLDLWRCGGRTPQFDDEEQHLLAALGPAITTALRTGQARLLLRPSKSGANALSQQVPAEPVLLLLDEQLQVASRTESADSTLRTLLPPVADARPIAACAYNVGAQLLAQEAGADDGSAWARCHLAGAQWLSLRGSRLNSGDSAFNSTAPSIAISIDPASPTDRMALVQCAAALTPREGELLHLVVAGLGNRQVAAYLDITEYTVQDHLKSIFAKTGTASRAELAARVTGMEFTRSRS